MEYNWNLYDTAIFGTVANTLHTLFKVPQGGDAAHTKSFTNARAAGQLPAEESMVINNIAVFVDVLADPVDIASLWLGSYLEFRISDVTVLQSPLSIFAGHNGYGGHFAQGSAADMALIGRLGIGRLLEIPIRLPGGTSFRVDIYQALAMGTAAQNVKCMLSGILNRG